MEDTNLDSSYNGNLTILEQPLTGTRHGILNQFGDAFDDTSPSFPKCTRNSLQKKAEFLENTDTPVHKNDVKNGSITSLFGGIRLARQISENIYNRLLGVLLTSALHSLYRTATRALRKSTEAATIITRVTWDRVWKRRGGDMRRHRHDGHYVENANPPDPTISTLRYHSPPTSHRDLTKPTKQGGTGTRLGSSSSFAAPCSTPASCPTGFVAGWTVTAVIFIDGWVPSQAARSEGVKGRVPTHLVFRHRRATVPTTLSSAIANGYTCIPRPALSRARKHMGVEMSYKFRG